jgi:hypothetical protein
MQRSSHCIRAVLLRCAPNLRKYTYSGKFVYCTFWLAASEQNTSGAKKASPEGEAFYFSQ